MIPDTTTSSPVGQDNYYQNLFEAANLESFNLNMYTEYTNK